MALPGLSLPGLGLSQPTPTPLGLSQPSTTDGPLPTRTEDLPPRSEWRFEAAFTSTYTIRLLSGHAELFGVELAPNHPYILSGCKGAIFTWQGCRLEISGEADSEYVGSETDYAVEWLNLHGILESARDEDDSPSSDGGPRVLIVGPDHVGKTSLVRSLAAWAVKSGRQPTIINLDPREGLLAPPGSLSASTLGSSNLDVETGYGFPPLSGATTTPVHTPLVYQCAYATPSDRPEVFKALVTRLALSTMNKLEEDPSAKHAGLLIDTPGSLNDPKRGYDVLAHIVSEFSISVILTLGSERLFNDLSRRFGGADPAPTILRVAKPGGAVERDAAFMKTLQTLQIRQYFFGTSREPLNPHSHTVAFADLTVWRANSPTLAAEATASTAYNGDDDDDEDDSPRLRAATNTSDRDFEKVSPSMEMLGRLCAIKFFNTGISTGATEDDEMSLRDAAVMGFAYVSEVDETKKRVRFLAPHPQRWSADCVLVYGGWPAAVVDLVG